MSALLIRRQRGSAPVEPHTRLTNALAPRAKRSPQTIGSRAARTDRRVYIAAPQREPRAWIAAPCRKGLPDVGHPSRTPFQRQLSGRLERGQATLTTGQLRCQRTFFTGDHVLETIRTRAKDQLPSVLLTLLSIIQALAIELLWTRLHEAAYLWEAGWPSVVGWSQVVAMLLGIFQIWLFYTSLVMRFRWIPSIRDSALPFVIGILEFTLIDLMGPGSLPAWFCTLAVIFGISVWAGQTIFRRARQDPENREFFETLTPARFRDFAASISEISALVLFGMLLYATGSPHGLSLAGLLFATGALAHQIQGTSRFWARSMTRPES